MIRPECHLGALYQRSPDVFESFVFSQRPRMLAQRCNRDLHVGMERQRAENIVKLAGTLNLEDADIRVLTSHPPEMQPLAFPLQFGGTFVFLFAQLLQHLWVSARGYMDCDIHMKQHG